MSSTLLIAWCVVSFVVAPFIGRAIRLSRSRGVVRSGRVDADDWTAQRAAAGLPQRGGLYPQVARLR